MTRHLYQRSRGFTLIELLVVITIIAILAGLLTVAVTGVMGTASEFTIKSEMRQIEGALEKFNTQYGFYPPSFKAIINVDENDPTDLAEVQRASDRLLPYINRIAPNHNETAFVDFMDRPNVRFIDQWMMEVGMKMNWTLGEDLVFWLSGLTKNKQFPLTGGFYDDTAEMGFYTAFNGQFTNGTIVEREVFFEFSAGQLMVNELPVVGARTASYIQASGNATSLFSIVSADGPNVGARVAFDSAPFLYLDAEHYLPLNDSTPITDDTVQWERVGFADANAEDGAYVKPRVGNNPTTLQSIIDSADDASLFQNLYENPTTFQLITFGIDGTSQTVTAANPIDANPNRWSTVGPAGTDNVVNFAGDGPNTLETLLLGTN